MSLPTTDPASEKLSGVETHKPTHLAPADAQTTEEPAVSGASSVYDHALEKEKTQPDVEPESHTTPEKTKTNATVLSRVVSRVVTRPQLPQSMRLVAIMVALALAMVSNGPSRSEGGIC